MLSDESGTAAMGGVVELPKRYVPSEHEAGVSARWEAAGAFRADVDRVLSGEAEPYCVLIPPPNVTARLHLGHAFNNGLQDVLVRAHRMMGFETLWLPGADHAGIATQTVVDKRLRESGEPALADYKKKELAGEGGRAAFVAKVQAWSDQYRGEIEQQLREMGCSCDWSRSRFTMDDVCRRAVREAFFELFKDGLIYRGKRLVNWDPVSLTALADDEVEMEEVDGHFVYLRYPLVKEGSTVGDPLPMTWGELVARGYPEGEVPAGAADDQQAWVTVATTRPETYMGDTAVALNPRDPRAGALGVGSPAANDVYAHLPLVGRIVPLIADDYVVLPDPEGDQKARMATGFLKVTPAHDPNDWEIGQRHFEDIEARNSSGAVVVNIMAPDASISASHGWEDVGDAGVFVGKSREEAAELVIKEFRDRGLLEKVVPYRHAVGHSYRSHVAVEPYLSDQWYCRVTDERLVGWAQRAVAVEQRTSDTWKPGEGADDAGDGAMRFYPERYAKSYESWHDNLRDWCISRQLWWGHRIPVWTYTPPPRTYPMVDDDWVDSGFPYALQTLDEVRAWIDRLDQLRASERVSLLIYRQDGVAATSVTLPEGALPTDSGQHYFMSWQICVKDESDTEVVDWLESHGFRQDRDVLDTWFSSALWPLSTLGWAEDEPSEMVRGLLEAFNPTSVLCTAREIITLWVSRMVMFNRYFLRSDGATERRSDEGGETGNEGGREGGPGVVPFWDVYIHSVIQDGFGQKMSKSLGNGFDPLDVVHSQGADAMRFVLTKMATGTQDVRLSVDLVCPHTGKAFEPRFETTPGGHRVAAPVQESPFAQGKEMVTAWGVASGRAEPSDERPLARNTSTKFDEGRNFVTKLYNAARFTLMKLEGAADDGIVDEGELTLVDRWMLSRIASTVRTIEGALAEYGFSEYANAMYDLLWRDFCDWYLEAVKPTVEGRVGQRAVLRAALDAILRLLHPICPFVTEVLYERVRGLKTAGVEGVELGERGEGLLCTAVWPRVDGRWLDEGVEASFDELRRLTEAVRQVRAQHEIGFRTAVVVHVPAELAGRVAAGGGLVETLANVERVESAKPTGDAGAVPFTFDGAECHVSGFAQTVDAGELRGQLEEQIGKLEKDVAALEKRLSNPGYTEKAPAHLVQQTRDQMEQKRAELEAVRGRLAGLGS